MPFNDRHGARENAGGSVGGILRKTNTHGSSHHVNNSAASSNAGAAATATLNTGDVRHVDLLVFGYACKIFRDDDKARNIDQGKHLIPWMGDNSLKIDRYDVRGALADLAPHEAPQGGYGNRLDYLSAEEQRAEMLCEEERYLFLYNNEEELVLQQEEDLKRLKQDCDGGNYSQVGFQYDGAGAASGIPQIGPNLEHSPNNDDEQAFVLQKNFDVPAHIQLPETMKQHAIIEKTARFIAEQGVQMEILLKAKQSNNVQFEFLTQDSVLNPYYKFVVNAIKNGTYPAEETTNANSMANAAQEAQSFDMQQAMIAEQLHAKTVITVPTIKYKPSANCAYTQLISKIKGVPLPDVLAAESNDSHSGTNTPTTPVLLQYNGNTYVQASVGETDDSNSAGLANPSNSNSNSNAAASPHNAEPQVELLKNSSALALAQDYASDSESEEEPVAAAPAVVVAPKPEPVLNFPIPPETLKHMIDKTAIYVIKNGRQFEETLRTKDDGRFHFLLPDNEYYPYYMYKITDDPDAASKEQKKRKAAAVAAALLSKKGVLSEKTVSPVSFSIKPKDENVGLPPALPQEPSDDEEDGKRVSQPAVTRTVPEHVQKAIQLVESQLMARNAQLAATVAGASARAGLVVGGVNNASAAGAGAANSAIYSTTLNIKSQMSSTKAEQERNALYEQQQQNRQKELKKAEEKVKDKLAQIAREKLGGLLSKEKQLQLERKRKAMAFLNQIKGDTANLVELEQIENSTDNKIKNADGHASDADSNASIHSIPITSYGPDEKTDEDDDIVREQHHVPVHNQLLPKIDKPKTLTVTLSDDDDVQVVSETRGTRHRRSRSKTRHTPPSAGAAAHSSAGQAHKNYRKRSASVTSNSSTSSTSTTYDTERLKDADAGRTHHRSKSRSHKSKKSKKSSKSSSASTNHSKRHKKKSKKHRRSHSRSYSRHRSKSPRRATRSPTPTAKHKSERQHRRRSYSSHSADSVHSSESHHRYRNDGKRSHKSSSSTTRHKEKKRKYER